LAIKKFLQRRHFFETKGGRETAGKKLERWNIAKKTKWGGRKGGDRERVVAKKNRSVGIFYPISKGQLW